MKTSNFDSKYRETGTVLARTTSVLSLTCGWGGRLYGSQLDGGFGVEDGGFGCDGFGDGVTSDGLCRMRQTNKAQGSAEPNVYQVYF